VIGGIYQTKPGWKGIEYRPTFIGDDADVTVPTPLGAIRSVWKREGSVVSATLSLPDGIDAVVKLPDGRSETTTGEKSWEIPA
jgi:hypothetical protein